MKAILSKINGLRKRRVDVLRTLWYSSKYPADHGKLLVAKETYVEADKKSLVRSGNVHIGCPKGLFGNIGIPGRDKTLVLVDNGGKLVLGEDVYIYSGARIIVGGRGVVQIGDNTSIAANSYLLSRSRIAIGSDCAISWDVQIMDTDFHDIADGKSEPVKDAPVVIGNHVLICSKATILKGVSIGNNSIIAANAVVTRDVPDGCIAAGNPARIIKENTDWK